MDDGLMAVNIVENDESRAARMERVSPGERSCPFLGCLVVGVYHFTVFAVSVSTVSWLLSGDVV